MSELYLTEERIRAVVRDADHFYKKARSRAARTTMLPVPDGFPDLEAGETMIDLMGASIDAVVGPGGGRFLADSNRLLWLLTELAHGSREDAIAVNRKRVAAITATPMAPAFANMARSNGEIHEARLRSIPQSELDAVMSLLDEIAKIYPGPVADVRARWTPVDREKLMEAVARLRSGDPSRPQLTVERIRRLLDVAATIVPGPRKLVLAFGESPLVLHGKTAVEVFTATATKKIRAQGEEPEAFARDFVWLRLIVSFFKRSLSIDERICEEIPRPKASLWIDVALSPDSPARSEKIAAWTWYQLGLLLRIGREEEAAVKSLLRDIEDRLRLTRQRQIDATNAR